MALTDAQKRKIEEEERYRAELASVEPHVATQSHGVPALLSFFIPGLGQIVKGQAGKGILIFIGFFIGLVAFVIPGVILWIWQIIDAYNN
jgi:TM2 domain-containing membrane protein YozV